ncbi:MAG: hypothetical protein ACREJU_18575 [Nitrospiraceae bacterium]
MAHYATDVIFFDCKPPFQTKGADAFRRIWEECLPYIPAPFGIERRDLSVIVSGKLRHVAIRRAVADCGLCRTTIRCQWRHPHEIHVAGSPRRRGLRQVQRDQAAADA